MTKRLSSSPSLRTPERDTFLREIYDVLGVSQGAQKIGEAYDFAARVHAKDMRRSGERYMCHIEDVVRRYIAIKQARNEKIAIQDIVDLLVHDTVEMHPNCEKQFRESFGNDAFHRQSLFGKPTIYDKVPSPFSKEWWDLVKEYSLSPQTIIPVIKENPYIFVTLWTKYATYNTTTKDIQEFFYACRILSYDEKTFEKKCADQLSNLHDFIDVTPGASDRLEDLKKKKARNDAMIFSAETVYVLKANVFGRKDLVKLLEDGIKARKTVALSLEKAIVSVQVAESTKNKTT